MLTCQDVTELVTDFVEGRMTLYQRMVFRMHMAMCKHCRVFIEQVRQTVEVTGEVPTEIEVPDNVRESLKIAFADWKKEQSNSD